MSTSNLTRAAGPKTNSAEKITMLRKGMEEPTMFVYPKYSSQPVSRSQCRSHELLPRLIRSKASAFTVVHLPPCVALTKLTSTLQYHQSVIDNARESAKAMPGRPLAIALDTVSLSHLEDRACLEQR